MIRIRMTTWTLMLACAPCFAGAGTIDTIAGNGSPSVVGQPFGVEMATCGRVRDYPVFAA